MPHMQVHVTNAMDDDEEGSRQVGMETKLIWNGMMGRGRKK